MQICNNYIKNGKPSVNLVRSLGHSFASGLALDRESYAAYGKGLDSDHTPDKKMFANFKQSLSLHHEMLLHEEAMKFEVIHEKNLMRSLKVRKNIVVLALHNVKSKAAAHQFPSLLSTASLAGVDIGDIGHSVLV